MKKKIKHELLRLWRYLVFGLQYLFLEKPRGLDFTMRDITLLKETGGRLHGYSKTSEKHIREIFDFMNITSEDSLIDIGCGKGVVLKEATRYPFGSITGIDIDDRLIRIARNNFQILKLEDRVRCETSDALTWDYSDYNVYFFCNPFDEEIFKKVLEKIMETKNRFKSRHIIYYSPIAHGEIMNTGRFKLVRTLYDPMKQNRTNIYELKEA